MEIIFNLYGETDGGQSYIQLLWMLPGVIIFGSVGYLVSVKLRFSIKKGIVFTGALAIFFIISTLLLGLDEVMFNSKWDKEYLVSQDAEVLKGNVTAARSRRGRQLYETIEIGNTTIWRIVPIYDKYLPDSCYQDLLGYTGFNNKEVEIKYIPLRLNEETPTEISYCITYVAVL
ncbi:hypothetical protein P2G88_12995 [Aliiglaciecola sp. CAU 1673]|uniref:hypothetical protein n=1 Tax=Aliiglaciecola sp. CAU 1673 TaxID=3032595 RepID=UPI0023DC85B8|nr:hypothetical protein [Aliiglaciecola sp. CAU 1673]MDF2179170.1 hypothetical protein [Aliiglaciecola sp. CAU 1673]